MGGLEPWSMENLNLLKIPWFNSDLATVILYLQSVFGLTALINV
jgi:hypothetical protein